MDTAFLEAFHEAIEMGFDGTWEEFSEIYYEVTDEDYFTEINGVLIANGADELEYELDFDLDD